jgi:hypothetical protein
VFVPIIVQGSLSQPILVHRDRQLHPPSSLRNIMFFTRFLSCLCCALLLGLCAWAGPVITKSAVATRNDHADEFVARALSSLLVEIDGDVDLFGE